MIDPQDVRWEMFHTTDRTEQFGDDGKTKASGGCCGGAGQQEPKVVESIEELPR